MVRIQSYLFFFLLLKISLAQPLPPRERSGLENPPQAPDYADPANWAAHPRKADAADLTPGKAQLADGQDVARVDVFFVHPTLYSGSHHPDYPWNADTRDVSINQEVDQTTIKYQASVFNATARVFAPRYRQAHLDVFTVADSVTKEKALAIAYEDVKAAFFYYLKEENKGRPFIIASHSQGTVHAARLMAEHVEDSPLRSQLIAAYLVGMPLRPDIFQDIRPCEGKTETGCWVSWNTYARDYYPPHFEKWYRNALSTNPLNWQIDSTYAARTENIGGVLKNFNKIHPALNDAQNHEGLLWIEKPRFFGNFLYQMKRYHIADYNLFYMNIRQNVADRAGQYWLHLEAPSQP